MEALRMAGWDFESTRRFAALTSTSAGSGSEKVSFNCVFFFLNDIVGYHLCKRVKTQHFSYVVGFLLCLDLQASR